VSCQQALLGPPTGGIQRRTVAERLAVPLREGGQGSFPFRRLGVAREVPHRHQQTVRAEHSGEPGSAAEQEVGGRAEAGQRVQRSVLLVG
jgi:hypothetical protein